MVIDKYCKIFAVNMSTGDFYSEDEGFFLHACSFGILPFLQGYKLECQKLGCGKEHIESIDILISRVRIYQGAMVPSGLLLIDRKYRFLAVPKSNGRVSDEKDGVYFSAADKAVLNSLQAIKAERDMRWPSHDWLGLVEGLMERIEVFQRDRRSKIPDTSLPPEVERRIADKGLEQACASDCARMTND